MRETIIFANSSNASYVLSFRSDQKSYTSKAPQYDNDKDKKVYVDFEEMESTLHPVLSFREDMMIPEEIKSELDELVPDGKIPIDGKEPDEEAIQLRFHFDGKTGSQEDQNIGFFVPLMTLEEFCIKIERLSNTVQSWVEDNTSRVSIDIEN